MKRGKFFNSYHVINMCCWRRHIGGSRGKFYGGESTVDLELSLLLISNLFSQENMFMTRRRFSILLKASFFLQVTVYCVRSLVREY